jgi:regulator of protease activity HflC (stomatin/prohibitin superfamily)
LLANEDIGKEKAALEAAKLKAQATKVTADAEAYAKKKVMLADGALEKKLDAFKWAVERNASAIENSKQPLVPSIVIGGDGKSVNGGSVNNLLQMMMVNEANKLNLNPNVTK